MIVENSTNLTFYKLTSLTVPKFWLVNDYFLVYLQLIRAGDWFVLERCYYS